MSNWYKFPSGSTMTEGDVLDPVEDEHADGNHGQAAQRLLHCFLPSTEQ